MEPSLILAIGVLIVLGGGGALLARGRALPWSSSPPTVPGPAAGTPVSLHAAANGDRPELVEAVALAHPEPESRREPAVLAVPRVLESVERELEGERFTGAVATSEALDVRLERIETLLDELSLAGERRWHDQQHELQRHAAEAARREAALDRLGTDLTMAVVRAMAERQPESEPRRAEVSADLYAKLARLEAALAAVSNPILLPGESYLPPRELLPEALIWENWNDAGERVFAFADTFNTRRLYLTDETRGEIGAFVTALRTLLTRSVYPNLQPEPSAGQQAALRAALAEIAAALPRVRETLEREFHQGGHQQPANNAGKAPGAGR